MACRQVSEALQIGAQAIKENKISVKEVEHTLQELEDSIDLQKQVETALGKIHFHSPPTPPPFFFFSFPLQIMLL